MAASAWEQRQAVVDLTDLAVGELASALDLLRGLSADEVRDALMEIIPALSETYGAGAAATAAEWFDEQRALAGVRGRFQAAPAGGLSPARYEALVRWGVDPLFSGDPDWGSTLALLSGSLQRAIGDRHRLTVVDNTVRDPQARGWRRVGLGETCTWCRGLIDRGGVYTEASVTFRSHDNCRCVASPTWDKGIVKVSRAPFEASKRRRSEEQKRRDTERYKRYLADTYGD